MKPVDDDLVVLCTVLPSQGYRSLANESVANHQQILKIELIFPIKQFLLEFLQNIKQEDSSEIPWTDELCLEISTGGGQESFRIPKVFFKLLKGKLWCHHRSKQYWHKGDAAERPKSGNMRANLQNYVPS